MKIFTTAAIKGGTGKSTTAAALSQAAAASGKKVLAIDLDPAGNLSMMLGADLNTGGSYYLLHGEDPADLIQKTEQGVDVIPGSPNLATEVSKTGSAFRLQDALEQITLEADTSSVQGLYRICDVARGISKTNQELKITGVILTRYDSRPKLNKYLRDSIEAAGKEVGAPFLGVIRPGVAIKESQALRQSLYLYAPKSKPAQDYMDIFKAIARK